LLWTLNISSFVSFLFNLKTKEYTTKNLTLIFLLYLSLLISKTFKSKKSLPFLSSLSNIYLIFIFLFLGFNLVSRTLLLPFCKKFLSSFNILFSIFLIKLRTFSVKLWFFSCSTSKSLRTLLLLSSIVCIP